MTVYDQIIAALSIIDFFQKQTNSGSKRLKSNVQNVRLKSQQTLLLKLTFALDNFI